MNPGHEVASPTTPAAPPPPLNPAEPLSPEAVLRWVAASGGEPWFPSAHAQQANIPRDSLDDPLNELRLAGLIQVATWVRGAGQGYALTPDGEAAAKNPAAAERLRTTPPVRPAPEPRSPEPDELPAEPDPEQAARSPAVLDSRSPVVTPALIAANVLWFLVGLLVAVQVGIPTGAYLSGKDTAVLHRLGAVAGPDLLAGQWWRLISSCFVHVGGLHLLGNLLALGMMGPLAELLWGRWRLVVVYALAGLAGSCLAMAHHPIDPDTGAVVILAGASGAIWGVLGSLLAWVLLFRHFLPPEVASDLFRRLGIVLMLNAGVSFLPGVSWEAHLGGGVTGFVAAGLLNALRFGDRPRRLAAVAVLAAMPLLCVGGLVAAMGSADSWHQLKAAVRAVEARAAAEAFERDVEPLARQLNPAAAARVEAAVWVAVTRSAGRRPGNTDEARAQVTRLREVAADVVAKAGGPPTGFEKVDQRRAKARAMAEARVKSLDLLLGLIDGTADPAACTAARAAADHLWDEYARP